jgi:hypothetical protein
MSAYTDTERARTISERAMMRIGRKSTRSHARTMSFDVVGQSEEDAHETKYEEMCCLNVRQEVGAMTS